MSNNRHMAHRTEQISRTASLRVHHLHLGKLATQQRQRIKGTEAIVHAITFAVFAHLSRGLQPYKYIPQAQLLDQLFRVLVRGLPWPMLLVSEISTP